MPDELKNGTKEDEELIELTPQEQIRAMLETTEKGKPKNSLVNFVTVFQQDPVLKGAIRCNGLTERTDIVKDLGWARNGTTITDIDMTYLKLHLEQNYGLFSKDKLEDAVRYIANENRYHPIQDYLNGLTWDGQERIRYVLNHFLGADTSDLTCACMKVFLLGAIERVFRPGCKFDLMLCLVGGQGAGKSSFFRLLAVRDEWFTDDLKKLDDENVFRKLQGHWIIEMSEMLATSSAKSVEEIKSFVSRSSEVYKVPYEVHPRDRLRQCVFGGTSNNSLFLPFDRSGNRRFLPILTNKDKAEVHILADEAASRAYIDQLWAEAMTIYRSGDYSTALPAELEDELREQQSEFMGEDTIAGLIEAFLDSYEGEKVCSLMLYREALNHPFQDPKRVETNAICQIMNQMDGWVSGPISRFAKYGIQRSWIPKRLQGINEVDPESQLILPEFRACTDDYCPFVGS